MSLAGCLENRRWKTAFPKSSGISMLAALPKDVSGTASVIYKRYKLCFPFIPVFIPVQAMIQKELRQVGQHLLSTSGSTCLRWPSHTNDSYMFKTIIPFRLQKVAMLIQSSETWYSIAVGLERHASIVWRSKSHPMTRFTKEVWFRLSLQPLQQRPNNPAISTSWFQKNHIIHKHRIETLQFNAKFFPPVASCFHVLSLASTSPSTWDGPQPPLDELTGEAEQRR